ncbi:hypothetical protein OSTOST_07029, partial [Ostertagia ostertagi]
MTKWAKFLLCLVIFHDVFSVHYWKISDDKKKIEAVPDSPYTLAYPGSLVDFLRQVDSVKKFGKTYVELSNVLKFDKCSGKLEMTRKSKNVYKLKLVGSVGLDRSNFKTSYSAELCPDFHKYYERYTAFVKEYFDMAPDDEKLLPRCRQWHQESQLKGLPKEANDQQLKTRIPDSDYAEILKGYFPHVKKLVSTASPRYGAIIAKLLSHQFETISAHPYLHLAAAAYWRQVGDLHEALSCYKTAVTYAEKMVSKGEEGGQLSLAIAYLCCRLAHIYSIKWRQRRQRRIAIWRHSFTMADPNGHSPCVFLKAQAAMADAAYLKLDASRVNGIQVEQVADFARILVPPNDSNYVAELLKFHEENLDHLVSEKLRFNDIYGDQMKIADQIRDRMVNERTRQSLILDRICRVISAKRFPRSNHPGNLVPTYHCEVTDPVAYEESMMPLRKATTKNRPPLNDTAWNVAEVFATDKIFEKKQRSLRGKMPLEPQMPKKYPYDSATWSTVRDRFWRRADWPSS